MKKPYSFPFFLALVVAALLSSCGGPKSTSGLIEIESLTPAAITDASMLYATYRFTSSDKASLMEQLSPDVMELVMQYGTEAAWPPAIDQHHERAEVREQMEAYQAFILAEFDGKYVLMIPAKLNKKMDKPYRPDKDIFFIISKEGVETAPAS